MKQFPGRAFRSREWLVLAGLVAFAEALGATSVVPISDRELRERADVVVYGTVESSDATVDAAGRPETLTIVAPLRVLKGSLTGSLVLHQSGGTLPDGRFFHLWGRPEYAPGEEVVVFAIARRGGEYQTAEMLLGKFSVREDADGRRFAVPELASGIYPGVDVHRRRRPGDAGPEEPSSGRDVAGRERELDSFLVSLALGETGRLSLIAPSGALRPVRHAGTGTRTPEWGNISNQLWRWATGFTAYWTTNGTANITGGGAAEAAGALEIWTNYQHAQINYLQGASTNVMYLNALTSTLGCGWTNCYPNATGVIGCGGPSGGSSNSWRGDSYRTITGGTVELRAYCNLNGVSSVVTQAILEHELGHTLGFGHSDQNFSPYDTCTGDESAAIMRSVVQSRTSLGTDDEDAARWIYGDGGTSCDATPPPNVASVVPNTGLLAGGTPITITGTGFLSGATVTVGGAALTGVVVGSTSITGVTPSHGSTGVVDVIVTNPAPTGYYARVKNGFTYTAAAPTATKFYTVTPCRLADTRLANGPSGGPNLLANASRAFPAAGLCGIPVTAVSVMVNVAAVSPAFTGDLRLYAAGTSLPIPSAINFGAGKTRANNAEIALGTAGQLAVYCDGPVGSTASVPLVLDVYGYWQ